MAKNLCHIPRNMRITAAMAASITDHVWDLAEMMEAALAVFEEPVGKPLVIPRPEGPARELPGGRGFLRLVSSGDAPVEPKEPRTRPAPALAPLPRQLSLLDLGPEGDT